MTSSRRLSSRAALIARALAEVGVDTKVRASLLEAANLLRDAVPSHKPTTSNSGSSALPLSIKTNGLATNLLGSSLSNVFPPSLTDPSSYQRAIQAASDRNDALVVLVPVPDNYAKRFPDPALHNHGHKPHITLCFVKAGDVSPGECSEILAIIRKACRRFSPFRVQADPNVGLRSFGAGDDGEKALWLPCRSDPRGELERLHRHVRRSLEAEGIEVGHHSEFIPHVTWAYVPNDLSESEARRMDEMVSQRFRDGFWWDVRGLLVSTPMGDKGVLLNPAVPVSTKPKSESVVAGSSDEAFWGQAVEFLSEMKPAVPNGRVKLYLELCERAVKARDKKALDEYLPRYEREAWKQVKSEMRARGEQP